MFLLIYCLTNRICLALLINQLCAVCVFSRFALSFILSFLLLFHPPSLFNRSLRSLTMVAESEDNQEV